MEEVLTPDHVSVIFVDDEPNILRSMTRLFALEDFPVLTAESGEKALEILRTDKSVGVIVSDQRMPGMSGVDFLEKARMISPNTTRIILTGQSDIKAAIDAINRGGAYRFLNKPWQDEELVQLIAEARQRYVLIMENKRLAEVIQKQNSNLKELNRGLEGMVMERTAELREKNRELVRLASRQKKNFYGTIDALSSLMELRDPTARNHSKNVARLSSETASRLNLSTKLKDTVTIAALLHDIGKIGISDEILAKDIRELSGGETAEYRMHTVRGQASIDVIEDLRPAGVLVRHHHEAFDGSGFPDGLSGEDIPLGSRIISICDFLDREVSRTNTESALRLLRAGAGTIFDPGLVQIVCSGVRKIYTTLPDQQVMTETELPTDDLRPGMIVSRDVLSGTGLLLLSRGVVLTGKHIQTLERYQRLDPLRSGVFVSIPGN